MAFVFGSRYLHQSFTRWVSSQYTHFYIWYTKCDCKLWNTLWFYCVFSYIFDDHSCQNCCVSPPKFHWLYICIYYFWLNDYSFLQTERSTILSYISLQPSYSVMIGILASHLRGPRLDPHLGQVKKHFQFSITDLDYFLVLN